MTPALPASEGFSYREHRLHCGARILLHEQRLCRRVIRRDREVGFVVVARFEREFGGDMALRTFVTNFGLDWEPERKQVVLNMKAFLAKESE